MRHPAFAPRSTTLSFVGALLLPAALAAETATPTPRDEVIEEIIVTGTRLPINASAPVTVLTHLDIRRGGASSIGDVLQALPMNAGSPLNTNVNFGGSEPFVGGDKGDGSTRIAFRGHSTLVLLNGRRYPNGGLGADASVDLNTIPMAFIERVEVLALARLGLGSVDWQYGPWRASYAAEYIGNYAQLVEPTPFGGPFAPFTRQVESILYHDLEGQYEFDTGVSLRAAVTNVTNEDPPFVNLASAANTDSGTYRLLGRTYFLELRYAFGGERT